MARRLHLRGVMRRFVSLYLTVMLLVVVLAPAKTQAANVTANVDYNNPRQTIEGCTTSRSSNSVTVRVSVPVVSLLNIPLTSFGSIGCRVTTAVRSNETQAREALRRRRGSASRRGPSD